MTHEAVSIMFPHNEEAFSRLFELDRSFHGTKDYMGITYFWNYAYRHYLRDASPYRRKLVHDAFIRAGLELDEESDAHQAIVTRYLGS